MRCRTRQRAAALASRASARPNFRFRCCAAAREHPDRGSVKSLRFPGHRTVARRPKRPEYRRIYAMREMQQLEAETRPGTGKGAAYRVRQKGLIPGVVYGGGGTPENVCVPQRELE